MENKYKLRIYKTKGAFAGYLEREEFFTSKNAMKRRYKQLFQRNLLGLNPTAWKIKENEWEKIKGY